MPGGTKSHTYLNKHASKAEGFLRMYDLLLPLGMKGLR